MRTLLSHRPLLLLLALVPACRKARETEPAPLHILPTPRELERGPDQPLGEALLVLPSEPSDRVVAAAEEIHQRLRELRGAPLKTAPAGSPEATAWRGRRIELALAAAGDATVPEAPQGHWLDTTDAARTRLVGRDEQGLVWAAMTFRRLLRKDADGRLILAGARVRDWPDFPLRAMNRLSSFHRERTEHGLLEAMKRSRSEPGRYADAYIHDAKRTVDFLARLKLNLVWLPLAGVPTQFDALARELDGADRAELFLATLHRVTSYAQARGLAVCDVLSTAVGTSPEDDDDLQATRCVRNPSQRRYYCWTQDERSRHKAEQTALLLGKAGYTMAVVQLPDGGGYANPGYWDARCKLCRWSTDRAVADAHLFALWHEACRKHAPTVTLAALQHPSDPAILLQPDDPCYEHMRGYWTDLHKLLPTDPPVAVCVRESAQPAVALFTKLFPGRPILVPWMVDATSGDHNWCPLYADRARFAKTFHEPGRTTWVLGSSSSCAPLAAAAAAQYLWNPEAPGAAPWPGDLDIERDSVGASESLASFATEAFGRKAAPWLLDAFRGGISPSYCLMPSDVARVAETPNTAARMRQQYEALVRASGGLERLWQRWEAGERRLVLPDSAPYFCGLSEQVLRSRAWASYHLARLRVAEGLRNGEPPDALAAELDGATRRVEADAALATRMSLRVANRPRAGKAEHVRWFAKSLRTRYDDTAYGRLTDDLQRLLALLKGRMTELRESSDADPPSLPLLPDDGEGLTLRGKGSTKVSVVSYPTQGSSGTAIQAEGLTQPWHDGFSVGFPPVDISRHLKANGVLRFYINGGGAGDQQLTVWLYARDDRGAAAPVAGNGRPPEAKGWPWVSLPDYVAVDDLEATWQLVTIPLDRLLPRGYTQVTGFGMNDATPGEVCGPLWLDTMYVAAPGEPVEATAAVQEPPAQPPATEAHVLAYGVQPTAYVTGNGMANRLLLALKVMGNGTLSHVRITLRFLTPEGKLIASHQAVAAERIRTPWWSASLRYDLGVLLPEVRVEMALTSKEVNGTGSVVVRW